jgi:heme/copper-type cytochrome/quinol oxidase subunit 4
VTYIYAHLSREDSKVLIISYNINYDLYMMVFVHVRSARAHTHMYFLLFEFWIASIVIITSIYDLQLADDFLCN